MENVANLSLYIGKWQKPQKDLLLFDMKKKLSFGISYQLLFLVLKGTQGLDISDKF